MTAAHPPARNEVTLSRTLGLLDITMIGVGAMIGAGIFVLTGIAAGEAGPALVLAFLLNGIVTTFTALSYAELGSCFPEAGGGYLWVKEGLGGTQGFLAGWMSWFAHAVACSLYGLGFGRFAVELILLAFPEAEALARPLTLVFMAIIVILFGYINFRGASETGLIGNVVTIAKIIILGVFIAFGIFAMTSRPDSINVFTESFLPHGIGGVFVAMGLTFIAFEGYEIIAQSGEEVKDPKYNIPRAVFISIIVVVIIYVFVAVVAIGAVTVPASAGNIPVWDYLAGAQEVAIVRAAEQFMGGWGGILILISGLASTMSALNATIYSSSRVSFAMGRGRNLPELFSRIHPKMHTPHWAIWLSVIFVIIMALSLPIDEVAKSADVMFLLMFAQVNITLITLRTRRPDLDRGYLVPFFPWPAIIGIVTNVALALFLAFETGRVGLITVFWLAGGAVLYWFYFRKNELEPRAYEIVGYEKAPVTEAYTVLVAVGDEEHAVVQGQIGALIAKNMGGDVFGLHTILLPHQMPLADGHAFAEEHRPILQALRQRVREYDVPVHTMLRVSHNVPESITQAAIESSSDLILLSWRTFDATLKRYSPVIDRIVTNPPADLALLRWRPVEQFRRIVVPVTGGPNGRLATHIAVAIARSTPEPTEIVLLNIATNNASPERIKARARRAFDRAGDWAEFSFTEKLVKNAKSVTDEILKVAQFADLVVIGATADALLRKRTPNAVAPRVADEANCPVIIVRRRDFPIL